MDAKNRIITILLLGFLGLLVFSSATPSGPTSINVTLNTTAAGSSSGGIVNISGGYIAKLNVTATVQNPHWKAFVGWIEGSFVLEDSTGSTIYDWSSGTTSGEVYATRASGAINWNTISCADSAEILAEETAMAHTGQDNISSTFSKTNDNVFNIAGSSQIEIDTCSSQNAYVSNSSNDATFEEIIVHDGTNIVYASVIEDASPGYDGANYDFQMLIPENGSSSFTGATAYYLYVEIS